MRVLPVHFSFAVAKTALFPLSEPRSESKSVYGHAVVAGGSRFCIRHAGVKD
jgi:hypothetical protein